MRTTFFAITFITAATFAQSLTPANLVAGPSSEGCPVGITAQQRSSTQTAWVYASEDQALATLDRDARRLENEAAKSQHQPVDHMSIPGLGLHVNLEADRRIQRAEVAVHYIPSGNRFVQADSSISPADRRKAFHLVAGKGSASSLSGNLFIGPAAGITYVSLLSITYTDGTTWHASRRNSCNVEPNRFVLAGAQ